MTLSADGSRSYGMPRRGRRSASPCSTKVGSAHHGIQPQRQRVVTASDDRTARVWDAATGASIGQPLRHENGVKSAAFSPDDARVVAVYGKPARVWIAAAVASNIVASACKMLGSNHDTADVFTRYGIDIKDPICGPDTPAPDPSRIIDG